jgi:putative peptidoglycan lipid II flippase
MDDDPRRGPDARTVFAGTVVLFGARLAMAALALYQAILLSTKFGASASTDAYFVASAVPLLFIAPIETALNSAFLPVFVHAAETDGEPAAWKIAAGLFRVGLLASGVVVLVLAALAPWISTLLAPGFDDAAVAQATQIIRITAPIILFMYAAAFLSSLEFVKGRSVLPAAGMVASAMAGPLALLFLGDRYGVVSLAWGALGGAVVRCCLVTRLSHMRRLMGPGLVVRDPVMRGIGVAMVSRLTTSSLFELNLLVDRIFASMLGPGFISALAYASRVVSTLVRLFMMPMGRMYLPWMSRLAARKDYDRMRGLLEKTVVGMAFLLVPMVAFVVAFRTELLGFVFGRGAFDAAAVEATSEALSFYALGIIPFLVAPMLSAAFFSMQDSNTPLRIGVVCVVANAGLDAILILGLGHGGIALASALVAGVRACLLWIYLGRRIGKLQSRSISGSLLVSAAAAVAAFWSARLAMSLAGPEWSEPLWRLAACAAMGGACYLLLQSLLNRPVARLIPVLLGRAAAGRP